MNLSRLRLFSQGCRCLAASAALQGLPLQAQKLWSVVPQTVTTQNLWSITYGNASLVAVGEHGTILSYDYGEPVWLPRESGTDVWLVGAGFGAGRFVVVGDRGTILTSDDSGATWTPRPSGTTVRLNAAAYGNGRWLVVGEQGTVLTSTDGTMWSPRPALGNGFLRALAFGRGQFLLGGGGGALYATTDATTFAAVPFGSTTDIESAAISATHFFVVGSSGLRASATQLGAWTISASTPNQTFRGIAVHSEVDATAVGDHAVTTNHTGTWDGAPYPPPFFATAIANGLNELVAVGFGGSVARSDSNSLFNPPHFIVVDPFPNVVLGGEARFRLFTDETALTYQWTRDGADILGATAAEFVLRNLTASASIGARYTTGGGTRTVAAVPINLVPGGRPAVRDPGFSSALPVVPTLVVPQPDGKLIVAGSFSVTTTSGPTYGLARLNANGSIDASFQAGAGIPATSTINGIALLADGRMYVWGSFSVIAGQPRPGLARLLTNGALDPAFNPDVAVRFPTAAAAAPDGLLYVQNGDANDSIYRPEATSVISRLTLAGSRDSAFVPVQKNRLIAVDAQGRLLALTLIRTEPVHNLVRYLLNGARDDSYTATPVSSYNDLKHVGNDLAVTQLTATGLYAASLSSLAVIGQTYSFWRVKPDGGRDPTYQPPPRVESFLGAAAAAVARNLFAYSADGSLWTTRAVDSLSSQNSASRNPTFRVESYDASGAANPGTYATLPDLSIYRIAAIAADGGLLATATESSASVSTMYRIRPITGRVGRLTNLSVRAFVTSDLEPLITGFVTSGTGTTRALVRAIGPGLTQFGVSDAMADPRLTLARDGVSAASNDNWDPALAPLFASVGAFPLPLGSKDAALESLVAAGNYTVVVAPAPADSGTGLVELYESADAASAPRRFVNISARGPVTSARPLIVGFTVSGDVPVTVLIRGAGPALTTFGVLGALADPILTLFRADSRLWENDSWAPALPLANAAASVGAFPFPLRSDDAAMLVTLSPGSYTAQVSGMNGTTGLALVEVYSQP